MPDPSDHDLLIGLGKDIKYVCRRLDEYCKRMDEVEKAAATIEDYKDFQKDAYEHYEKYDAACVVAAGCPARWEDIEGRVRNLEQCRLKQTGEEESQSKLLERLAPLVGPALTGLIVAGLTLGIQMWMHLNP